MEQIEAFGEPCDDFDSEDASDLFVSDLPSDDEEIESLFHISRAIDFEL
jgi:hypothetical protein